MRSDFVQLALDSDTQQDIIWFSIIAVIFVIGVIWAIRSN